MLHRVGIYDTHTLDDLAAKATVKAWKSNIDKWFDPAKGEFNGLLYSFCSYEFLMYLRTRGRDRHRFLDSTDLSGFNGYFQVNAGGGHLRENTREDLIYTALESLPEAQQNVIREYLSLNRLPREASELEKSQRIELRKQYRKALKMLRMLISRQEHSVLSKMLSYKRISNDYRVN